MRTCFLGFLFLGVLAAGAQEDCGLAMCRISALGGVGTVPQIRVMSPIGVSETAWMKPSEPLDSLEGKTIALVGGSFMARVTHLELKRLLGEHFPTAKVLLLGEIGSAGVWPGPGVRRPEKDVFQARLKEYGVDAVVAGNGGCGLCTPKEMGSCIAAEDMGIRSVMIASESFAVQAKKTALVAGVREPRVAVYPGSFVVHSEEELRRNTREVLWPQVVEALTAAVGAGDAGGADSATQADADGIVYEGSLDEVQQFFADNGWTDGLPIILPTQERVEAFLRFTDMAADEVLLECPVAYRKVTPRLVAINGVMAGCPAEFMPILVAFTRALGDGDFRRTLSSTHAWTPYCWLNGPVARQLRIDCSQGEISEARNAVIGRFINLAMRNLGGYYIKENRMGTFGYLMPWCLAEDEEACLRIGWLPWHTQHGFGINDNVLTAASALSWGNNLAPATSHPERISDLLAWDMVEKQQFALGSGTPKVYRTVLLTEYVARDLAGLYPSKRSLEEALLAKARNPLDQRTFANYYGNPGSAFNEEHYPMQRHKATILAEEHATLTPTPPWLAWSGKETIATVPVMQAGKTAFLVTGDASRNKAMTLPGGGFALVPIELPRNWNALMAELGYAPLVQFTCKK